ncbi:branched-chain amino acid ABC transporter permease [Pseudooceanicola aestuarii]|uniref:branched-chain amino acid ABC transporter permease n=1 Tax=Pseudooceanicola aestuarii TaxID=2697319 RepID=UPI0013D83DB2|nr:branched-chain amino acid ABC transporter permease [Pseudooceanicola aestuarii]
MAIIQVLVSGIALGCVYALIALGFVLIYKATETVNFAQGELMMLGAMLCVILMRVMGLPFWMAAMASVVAMAGVGALTERVMIRPVLGQPQFAIIMLTIGFGYLARGAVTMIPDIGTDTTAIEAPWRGEIWEVGGIVLGAEQGYIILATALLCGALFLLFRYTLLGIAMQASSQNQIAAYYVGIPVKRLNTLVWALSALVATVAGLLIAPITFVHANMGFIGLKAFPAAIVGGFGSLPGAVIGGLVIGLVEALAGFYLPEGFKDIAPYVVVLIMLAVRPTGLFGESLGKKV